MNRDRQSSEQPASPDSERDRLRAAIGMPPASKAPRPRLAKPASENTGPGQTGAKSQGGARKPGGGKSPQGDSLRVPMPSSLGIALSQLFRLKGYANSKTDSALADTWNGIVGERIGSRTVVLGVQRGVFSVGVASAALLNELVAFHKGKDLKQLQDAYPHLKLRDIKFRLKSNIASPPGDGKKPQ